MIKPFHWEKQGLIFSPDRIYDRPAWMHQFAQAPSTVVFPDRIRIYFSCRPKPNERGQYVSYSAYVDVERKDMTRIIEMSSEPILSLGSLGNFDEFGTYPVTVIKYGEKFRAYYGGWTRCVSVPFNVGIGVAESEDGKTFTRLGQGPILSYSPDEPFILSGPKIRKFGDTYYLFYIAGKKWIQVDGKPEPIYTIRAASSADGLVWQKWNKELIPWRIEENESQASPDVFYEDGMYHMFFSYRRSVNYRGREGGYRIGYAYSQDLVHWERADHLAGIDVSEDGFDSEMVAYPHILKLDGKTYMFYLGNGVGREGFGLAELKKD